MTKDLPKDSGFGKRAAGYVATLVLTALVTLLLAPLKSLISITGVALCFLLVVLLIATVWGSRPAMFMSILAMLSFNFFFIPPIGTLSIAEPANWVALITFLIVALTAGQLSARLKFRAEQAEAARAEIAGLYEELNQAFEKASEAEAAKRSDQFKSALLDAVSHDLRTPLTSIKASVTMLLKDRRDSSDSMTFQMTSELLSVIDEETDRLDKFVAGLLEMAKLDAGEFKIGQNWASIDEIIGDALNRAKPRLEGRRIKVEIEGELPSIRVDARSISEVLYNLLENAAKYSPKSSTIRLHVHRNTDDFVRFVVDDDGPGVPSELSQKIFEKFYRIQGTREPGHGLGLAIAKGIVDAHGGTIGVSSNDTGGARFFFSIPIGDD